MDMKAIADDEKREIIEFMLDNAALEEKMGKWKQKEEDILLFMDFTAALVRRSREDGGLIISVESGEVPPGAENIEIFRKDTKGDVNIVIGENKQHLAMIFTSRERFKECDDTSGFVMFIDELFEFLGTCAGIDGVIINYKKENVVLNKEMLGIFLDFMSSGKNT